MSHLQRLRCPMRAERSGFVMADMAVAGLSAVDLACVRGGRTVFSGLGFAVSRGQALLVTGPNGVGKTTLIRMLAGLLRPSAGVVTVSGAGPEAVLPEHAHYLGHQDALKPALTVAENLGFWATYLADGNLSEGLAPQMAVLSRWGLGAVAGLPAAYLSAGQRRRLSLCRLTAAPRPVWLLDEPTAALDAAASTLLGEVMAAHLADGGIIVAATHGPLPLPAEVTVALRLSPENSVGEFA